MNEDYSLTSAATPFNSQSPSLNVYVLQLSEP